MTLEIIFTGEAEEVFKLINMILFHKTQNIFHFSNIIFHIFQMLYKQ